ncbi:MFS drug transporter [Colletotrichum costaricense]|uniref:MFS drug transporter n=1 Tax=Colletotrichum costaricense TaxID=1209916 RepID=A0AAJ0DVJ8_9PEZI|nr:MFS drug transporter [Colletotrichum costaricense]KAK1515047.1 MFS drug transporter [Colletotrichum costaricense]
MFKSTNSANRTAQEAADINASNPESSHTPDTALESPTPTDKRAEKHMFNEQTNYVSKVKVITIFLACASVDLVALMDQTTLAASLSIVGNYLHAGQQLSWLANGYFITSTVGQLLYGRLSDIWSRKVILMVGLAIFGLGSLASSLAQTATQLIVFRCFTGLGGGGLMTVAQMIVSDVVPLRERGKYQGILGAVTALANGIGPVIGGTLSSKGGDSWRWIFRLNLPLTALSAGCALFFMPLRKVEGDWKVKTRAIDFVGIFLALAGTTSLMLGLTWGGGEYPWASAAVLTTLIVGAFICVIFVLWQWKGPKYPLVPLDIFRARMTIGACITMAINGWNFVVQVYYIPTFYQLVYNYGATRSGVMLLPITLVQTASSTLSGLIVHWVGRYRECILFGWLCWSVGLGLMSTLNETSGLGKQIGYSLLIGVGVGNTLQPALVAIQAGVPRKDMAVVTSFRNFVRNLGATFGLAICGTILNNIVKNSVNGLDLSAERRDSLLSNPQQYLSSLSDEDAQRIRDVLAPAYQRSFKVIFELGSGLAAAGFFVAWVLMPHIDLARPDDHKLKEEGHQAQLKGNAEKSP